MASQHAGSGILESMRLTQFSYLCAVVESGFSVSRAAASMGTTQPLVSKQLRSLERELGFEVLARKRNRILGLTPSGEAVLEIARRIAADASLLTGMRGDVLHPGTGTFTVATTHIHARYTLLAVIKRFCAEYPEVSFTLRHSDPAEIAELVSTAKVDLGICVPAKALPANVACIPGYPVRRVLITAKDHPLLRRRRLDMAAIAEYPLITYDTKFSSGWRVLEAFDQAGVQPHVVLTAIDAEVIKAYVAEGIGVAFLQSLAYDARRDRDVAARSVDHLVPPPTTMIMVRRNGYLRGFGYRFIQLIKPSLPRVAIREAMEAA